MLELSQLYLSDSVSYSGGAPMRSSRLLSMLLLLQARGRMTAQQLAETLEVSLRTVYRDVESLSAAGVPIYADRGPTGGYQLVNGYRTRLTGLTADEAEALFLSGMPQAAAEMGLGTVLATAQLKVLAALPADLRERAGRIRERFYLDAPTWFQDGDEPPYLTAVADAVWNQHPLRMRYQRAGSAGERRRLVEPLGLALKAGAWYLIARACASDAHEEQTENVRVYRVSRILDLQPLDERFERPEGFMLETYWRQWLRDYERRVYRSEAVIRLSPRGRQLLPYFSTPVVAQAAAASQSEPDADGWTHATIPIESIEHAVGDLLRYGADVEALEPPELRERLIGTIRALSARYALS